MHWRRAFGSGRFNLGQGEAIAGDLAAIGAAETLRDRATIAPLFLLNDGRTVPLAHFAHDCEPAALSTYFWAKNIPAFPYYGMIPKSG
jgi:hypothetical protein